MFVEFLHELIHFRFWQKTALKGSKVCRIFGAACRRKGEILKFVN
jgi:hypothetical protein